MKQNYNRRNFIKAATVVGIGMSIPGNAIASENSTHIGNFRVGIIGLDTSHCIAFTKALNNPEEASEFGEYKVVAAYPTSGSEDLPSSIDRVGGFTEQIKQMGVEVVGSIEELLKKVDVILLETVDGRKHLEQALPVIKAGKRMFIDKPMAASLADVTTIFDAAKSNNVPIFSSSALRYITGAEELSGGKKGKVLGADTFGPASIEKTHPDLFWYGIHGIEALFAVMGTGCKSVVRINTEDTDMVVGTWKDGRIGSYRGTRTGKGVFGGTVFTENGQEVLGEYKGYKPLLKKIIEFFRTGVVPVSPEETLEIFAFMEAADESKIKGFQSVDLNTIIEKAKN